MSLVARLLDLVGDTDDEDETYRCIRCSGTFEREHYECPDCGVPHAVHPTDERESGRNP